MRFVVQGLTYPEAVKLKTDLLSAGIESGETAGAIAAGIPFLWAEEWRAHT